MQVNNRKGFTLIEALVVVVMIGILAALAYPRLTGALAKNNVRAARGHIISMYAQARAAAVETNRIATLNFGSSRAWITASPRLSAGVGVIDTIGQVDNLTTRYGVTVTGTPATTLSVDPRGFGSSAATTIFVTRTGFTDSMVVSAFGRVVK